MATNNSPLTSEGYAWAALAAIFRSRLLDKDAWTAAAMMSIWTSLTVTPDEARFMMSGELERRPEYSKIDVYEVPTTIRAAAEEVHVLVARAATDALPMSIDDPVTWVRLDRWLAWHTVERLSSSTEPPAAPTPASEPITYGLP